MKDIKDKALNIDLKEYAFLKGYTQLEKGKESSNWITIKNPSTGDSIRIKKKSNPMVYSNNDPNLDAERGNIVNFVLNRLNGYPVANPKPTSEQFREAFKVLEKDLGEVSTDTLFNKKNEFTVSSDYSNSDDAKKKIKNLQDPSEFSYNYLRQHRNINPEIIHHPIFSGKFKESPVIMSNNKVICNLAVVKTDMENKPTGIVSHFFSSRDQQCKKKVYDIHENIWKSNPYGDVKALIYGETAMDILSHFEIYGTKNCMYASLEGNISNGKLEPLFELYKSLGDNVKLVSITDNDYSGYSYDMKTAVFFHNKLNPDKPIEVVHEQNYIKYVMNGQLNKDFDLKAVKEDMLQYLRLESPQQHSLFTPYLNLIQTKDYTIFEVPYKKDQNKVCLFLKPLIELLHKNNNIEFVQHKSKCKDWNEDLVQKKTGQKCCDNNKQSIGPKM
jgi:hypothetical protein